MKQVKALLDKLEDCKKEDEVNGVGVVRSLIGWRIQPIKEWIHPSYEYEGTQDTTRESLEPWKMSVLNERVSSLFQGDVKVKDAAFPSGYHLGNPLDQVCSLCRTLLFAVFRVSLTRPPVD